MTVALFFFHSRHNTNFFFISQDFQWILIQSSAQLSPSLCVFLSLLSINPDLIMNSLFDLFRIADVNKMNSQRNFKENFTFDIKRCYPRASVVCLVLLCTSKKRVNQRYSLCYLCLQGHRIYQGPNS